MPALPDADAMTVTEPVKVLPDAGAVMDTVGGVTVDVVVDVLLTVTVIPDEVV